jgi:predicted PurR-regulated permease PerM
MQGHPLWDYLNTSSLVRYLLLFACGWATIEILDYFQIVVIIFVSSTILAFLLSRPVGWLKRFLPHNLAAMIVFVVALATICGIVSTVGFAILSQGQPVIDNIVAFLTSITSRLEWLERWLARWNLQTDLQFMANQLKEQAVGFLGAGVGVLQMLLSNFVHGIFIAVVTFFMLLDGDRLWQLFLKLLPVEHRDRVTQVVQQSLLGFFWGKLLLCLFFGTAAFLAFLILKVPYALTLAVTVALFDLIPGIGATLGISLIMLFLLSQSIFLAIQVGVVCVLLQQLEENVLLPLVMKDSLNINPVLMFFALIVGARIAGILGLFLAIPVASVIVSLLEIEEMKGKSTRKLPLPQVEE